MKLKDSYHFYAIITIFFWAMAFVFTRLALRHFSAYSLGFLRYLIASCALAVIVVAVRMKLPRKRDVKWFVISGAVGFFLYMIVFNKGSETLNASTSSVILAVSPVLTALAAHFIYKERLKIYQWLALAVAFSGVAVLNTASGVFIVNIGIIWQFCSVLLMVAYNILQRKLTKTYTALQSTAFSIFAGTIMLGVFLPKSLEEAKNAPAEQFFYLSILGIFSSAIAYISWSKAFAKAKYTSSVSNYMFVTPFLTTVLGFFIAGEIPDSSTVFGGGIIFTGLIIFSFGNKLRFNNEKYL